MSLQFLVVAGPDKGQVLYVQHGPDMLLGRGKHAYYQLNDPRVSRSHFEVLREGDQVKAGQLIAVLDDAQIKAREDQERSAVAQALSARSRRISLGNSTATILLRRGSSSSPRQPMSANRRRAP